MLLYAIGFESAGGGVCSSDFWFKALVVVLLELWPLLKQHRD